MGDEAGTRTPRLIEIPADTPPANCRSCGTRVYWVRMPRGGRIPIECDVSPDCRPPARGTAPGAGVSHLERCPQAPLWRAATTTRRQSMEQVATVSPPVDRSSRHAAATPLFTEADFKRARVLVDTGRRNPADPELALGFLRRLLDYAEQLRGQRTALRMALRSMVVEREGRLCYVVEGEGVLPMPQAIERAVRAALAASRPSAA